MGIQMNSTGSQQSLQKRDAVIVEIKYEKVVGVEKYLHHQLSISHWQVPYIF